MRSAVVSLNTMYHSVGCRMKVRRCGPVHGYSRWCWVGQLIQVRFYRRSRFTRWFPTHVRIMSARFKSPAMQRDLEALLVKKIDATRIKKMGAHLLDLKGLEKLPQLRDFLVDTELVAASGTEERDSGSVYFSARGGQLQVTLKEPSQAMMMRLECPNIASLWTVIEAALGDEGSMWEVDTWARSRGKRKKK